MILYQGLPILTHCYREFVILPQHCVRQRFTVGARRCAPARPAASSAALSCLGCSTRSGCPAPAAGGLAASQTFASAATPPYCSQHCRSTCGGCGLWGKDREGAAASSARRGWGAGRVQHARCHMVARAVCAGRIGINAKTKWQMFRTRAGKLAGAC